MGKQETSMGYYFLKRDGLNHRWLVELRRAQKYDAVAVGDWWVITKRFGLSFPVSLAWIPYRLNIPTYIYVYI
jgi:hypothetical protein